MPEVPALVETRFMGGAVTVGATYVLSLSFLGNIVAALEPVYLKVVQSISPIFPESGSTSNLSALSLGAALTNRAEPPTNQRGYRRCWTREA